jgi:predicted CoA-binding protein
MTMHDETNETFVSEVVVGAKVVAVVGMKGENDPSAPAFYVPAKMKRAGIRVIPVNPKLDQAFGERALASLAELHDHVDVILVFRRSDAIGGVADDILALDESLKPKVVWLQLGIKNDASAERLRAVGIDVIQDRCFAFDIDRYRAIK